MNAKITISRDFGEWVDSIDRKKKSLLRTKVQESLEYMRTKMADYAPKNSGDLVNTILSLPITSVKTRGFSVMYGSGSLEVSLLLGRKKDKKIRWVNDGTGLFGPHRKYIYPTTHSRMTFKIDGRWISVERTKGQVGKKFIQSAINHSKLIVRTKILSALKS